MRCYNCGKEVDDGTGYWTDSGFVCRVCADSLDFLLCDKCGRRYRRADMLEWEDRFYCKGCAKVGKPIVRQRPLAKFGGGAVVRKKPQEGQAKPGQLKPARKGIRGIEPSLLQEIRKVTDRDDIGAEIERKKYEKYSKNDEKQYGIHEKDEEKPEKYKEIDKEIRQGVGETEKDKDIDSLAELKALGDKLKEARSRKKKKEEDDYGIKPE